MHNLTRLRRHQSKLLCEAVDATGLRKLSFSQLELAVLFAQLLKRLLFGFDPVAAFNSGGPAKKARERSRTITT